MFISFEGTEGVGCFENQNALILTQNSSSIFEQQGKAANRWFNPR